MKNKSLYPSKAIFVVSLAIYLSFPFVLAAKEAFQKGIVHSIVNAPVAVDGTVAGAATDFVINFDLDMDPSIPGKTLAKGSSIRIKLPEAFVFADSENYPLQNVFGAKDCVPGNFKCSTAVLSHGWPQNPILPSFPPGKNAQYTLSFESDTNTLIFTANVMIKDVPLPGPGIKQMHLILLGFKNPTIPGRYPIHVSIMDETGAVLESGMDHLLIRPTPAPSINVTSVFVPGDVKGGNPPNPNTIYQTTVPNRVAPMPWDFLMWDANGTPYTDIEIIQTESNRGELRHKEKVVGWFFISAPEGAMGQKVTRLASVAIPGTPVIGKSFGTPIPAGRLTAQFTAGSKAGRYVTHFEMNQGNQIHMIVDVASNN